MVQENMAISNRRLLSWFTSRNPVQVGFKLLPLLALLIYVIYHHDSPSWWIGACAFLLGVLTWSLIEYVIHRWVYHRRIRAAKVRWILDAFHIHHHRNLTDYKVLNAGFLLVYPLFFIIGSLAILIIRDWSISAWYVLGILLYYFTYEIIHYLIHYKQYRVGYMGFIQQYHLYHHFNNWNVNFGNTTSLWDRLLNTYHADYKTLELTEEQARLFITSEK